MQQLDFLWGVTTWRNDSSVHSYMITFLNQARGLRLCAPGFLKLFWFAHQYVVCVCVCVSTPKAIKNQWHDMV